MERTLCLRTDITEKNLVNLAATYSNVIFLSLPIFWNLNAFQDIDMGR